MRTRQKRGDPWGVEQHHWNTGAEENQELNPGGPSNRQNLSTNDDMYYSFTGNLQIGRREY